jgi:hypothetical protein
MNNKSSPRSKAATPTMTVDNAHSHQSVLRERIVEHIFIGEALRLLWERGITDVEVLRSEFDAYGYDLVLARGAVVRHIQFKTGLKTPSAISVPLALASKPSGCLLWIQVRRKDLALGPFLWFGGAPGEPLPRIGDYAVPLRATHNKAGVRPPKTRHRLVPNKKICKLDTLVMVVEKLFGPLPAQTQSVGKA